MNYKSITTSALILSMIISHNAMGHGLSFKKISSAFGGKPFQEIIKQQYSLQGQKILVVDNKHGNITIQTDCKSNRIAIEATIHKSRPEDSSIHIVDDMSKPGEFALRTIANNEKCKNRVDYVIIAPEHIKLQLSTGNGKITVNDTHSIVMATTNSGDILFNNLHNKAQATTRKSGSIYCNNCSGSLYTTTHRGNIKMRNVHSTVVAKTKFGKVDMHCSKDFTEKSLIDVSSTCGNIVLSMPENTNAAIKAHTQKGICVCEHYVTLRPQTTKLNNAAWAQFKRSVDGTIGSGAMPVQISSVNSNIRINTRKTS